MEEMTIAEVLEITAQLLSEIRIPAALAEEIGLPISRAVCNLHACLEAIRREENNKADGGPEKGAV